VAPLQFAAGDVLTEFGGGVTGISSREGSDPPSVTVFSAGAFGSDAAD
jgi:hypothetical protein